MKLVKCKWSHNQRRARINVANFTCGISVGAWQLALHNRMHKCFSVPFRDHSQVQKILPFKLFIFAFIIMQSVSTIFIPVVDSNIFSFFMWQK